MSKAGEQLERLAATDYAVFSDIRNAAWGLLLHRLNDPVLASEIETNVLARLAMDTAKVQLQVDRRSTPDTGEARTVNVTNVFLEHARGLPVDRQVSLLAQGVRVAETNGADPGPLRAALVELVGETETANLLAIEGVVL